MLTLEVAPSGSLLDVAAGREVNVWRDERGEICARLFRGSASQSRWIDWPGLGVFSFALHSRAVRVYPAPQAREDVLADTFVRILQPAILQALGWQAVHASAVAGPTGVLAFCGLAHSGKSTLAYALSRLGFSHFADDALVINVVDDSVRAHALPFTARLRRATRVHFELDELASPRIARPPATTPMSAFFLLRQDASQAGPPKRERVPAARAFSQLMTHAHCFDVADPAESQRIVEDYLEIVERVPVFSLTYRPGFEQLDELLETVVGMRGVPLADAPVLR